VKAFLPMPKAGHLVGNFQMLSSYILLIIFPTQAACKVFLQAVCVFCEK